MHVDLVRDKAKAFPGESIPSAVTSLKVWHCAYKTLAPMRALSGLRRLVVATYPDDSFELIAALQNLESLDVLHFPNVTSLEPLAVLPNLRTLKLASLPSWDASSKRLIVDSLEPLAKLPRLKVVHLLGVVPHSRSLAALEASQSLSSARFHGYPVAEQKRFFQVTGTSLASSEA